MTDPRVRRVIEVVAAGAILATAALVAFGPMPDRGNWIASAFFATFGLLASGLAYKTSSETTGTIGFLPFLSVAALSPNFAAVASVAVGVLGGELLARKPPVKVFFNVIQQVFAESLAILVFLLLGGTSGLKDGRSLLAFVAMVTVFMAVNKLAVSTIVSATGTSDRPGQHWLKSMKGSMVYDLFAFPLILFFAKYYAQFGPEWSAALALPMLGIRQLYKTNFALQKINEELLQLMVAAIEARDPYTSGHSQRVARYARVIAKALGIGGRVTERVAVAALLHDVGKIHEEFAPILRKPDRLTDEEFEIMKTHSERSAALVAKVSHFADLVPLVRSHHEAWDGSGYPQRLVGQEIPLGARIIALADTIDAMSTSRPYRRQMTVDMVRDEIARESGRQFDPSICRAILTNAAWQDIQQEIVLAVDEHPYETDISRIVDALSVSSLVVAARP